MRYNQGNYYRPSFSGGFGFFPPVIKTILIANVVIFLLQIFLGSYTLRGIPLEEYIYRYFALIPMGYGFKVWQLFTYMFLHSPDGISHILINMLMLWMFGMEIEHVLGSKKFFLYYILCGVGGGITNLLMGPFFQHPAPTIGASGAVMGILLAFGLLFPDRMIFIYFLIPIKAKYFILLYLGMEILAVGNTDMVAHLAHLGGALTGYIFLMVDNKKIPFQWLFDGVKKRKKFEDSEYPYYAGDIESAKYYDIKTGKRVDKDPNEITQEIIDTILDKISKSGYQSLTEEEKRILFEASKRLE
jgi:membrane associated rhomboid family serine protease